MTWTSRLNKIPLFEGLSDAQIAKIEDMGIEEEFQKGDYVFRQGEPAEWLYIILKGKVKLVKHAPTGAATIIEIYSVGDELTAAPILEGKTYPASAKALSDGIVLKISANIFKKMMNEWPQITANLMRTLGIRYRELMDNLSSLAVFKVEGRLCKVMASLAKRYGIMGDKRGVILDLDLTRQDLADITGTTLETTIRTLNKLKNGGLINWEGKRFFIPDLKALDNMSTMM